MKNLKSFFVFLGRNKLYTFINVFGLSVSLLFVILIANYTVGELRTDRIHKNLDQIYIVTNGEYIGNAHGLLSWLEGKYPEIEKSCGVASQNNVKIKVFEKGVNASILFVDSTFFDVFSFKVLEGDRTSLLQVRNSVVLSETFANKIFGNVNPIGQEISLSDSVKMIVGGVFQNFKNTMFVDHDMIMPFDNIKYYNPSMLDRNLSNAGSSVLFLQTYKGSDIHAKTDDMLEYVKTFYWPYMHNMWDKVELIPMKDVYLSDMTLGDSFIRFGDFKLILILLSVGLLILLFAVTNYINLTVSQTGFRAKEIATRRLLGSSRGAVFTKMILESLIMCGVAFIFGLLLAASLERYANELLGANISVLGNATLIWVCSYVVFVLLISIISGVIPAIAISKFKPIDVVKGSFRYKSKMIYSKLFIVFQNVITVALIACALTMVLQVRHLMNADLNYQHDAIIRIGVESLGSKENIKSLRNELLKLPCVESVAFTQGTPASGSNNAVMSYKDGMIDFQSLVIDSAAFKLLGFQPIVDNKVAEKWTLWFNETAMKAMNISIDTASVHLGGQDSKIGGVVRDFQIGNVNQKIKGCYLRFDEDMYPWDILVKVNGDLVTSYNTVGEVYEKFSDGTEFTGRYMDDDIRLAYESQRKTAIIVTVFAFIAVLISALGLLAMATYFIQQRSMEIAVRKVFGSTSSEMLKNLMGDFLILVAVAFVIAVPIIWYAMSRWLEEYSYRISLSPWIFVVAGLIALLIAFVTIYWQSYRAANANPVKSIKS